MTGNAPTALPTANCADSLVARQSRTRQFTRLLVLQFEQVFRYLGETHGLSPEDWLLLRLTDLAVARRLQGVEGEATELPDPQADLATMVGVSRQTLNTLLARLGQRGLIEVGYRSIRVNRARFTKVRIDR